MKESVPPWPLCQRILLLCIGLFCGFGQSASSPVDFEVAAIYKSPTSLPRQPISSTIAVTDSRLEFKNRELAAWIAYAYDTPEFLISGPDWILREGYDLSAKLPDGSTKRDAPAMLQSLLAERFGLRIHREVRKMSGYALVVGKASVHIPPSRSPGIGSGTCEPSTDGLSPKPGIVKFAWRNCTMSGLALLLSKNFREAVIDATNLAGTYDIAFEVAIQDLLPLPKPRLGVGAADGLGSSIVNSLDHLGLKLERDEVAVETIMVDNISRPTAN